jgi:chromosome segregation ATPase
MWSFDIMVKEVKYIKTKIPDSSVWDSFLEHIKDTYGKTYGFIGMELQNALIHYIENPQKSDINEIKGKYQGKIEKLKNKINTIEQRHSKELQKANDTISNLKKTHDNEVKKLKQKITVAEALNKQTERIKERNHDLEKDIEALKREKEYFQGLQEKNENLQVQHDKLRNKHDHLQERFNKSQKELIILEREVTQLRVVVAKIEKMSLWERLINRLPSEVKELSVDGS